MFNTLLTILIGITGGLAVGVQSPISGQMGQRVGGAASSFIVHFSGMLLSGLYLVFQGGARVRDWLSLPWYMLGSGVFGLILYLTINYTLPRLGAASMAALIITGQLLVGILVDHFGWFGVAARPLDLARAGGALLLLAGGYLLSR
ncbi:MAG: DMT family transporter [Chloroflexi bacterium]|jgi:transporter family-2 protein|nr:DMT family transporter [Anaerolineaceae bacterium]NMB90453.1 DMT family transporter [Chloroflexota bacterium]